ncbi:MAG: DUF4827 domain-containing protein [Bacteroidaceae bacterium]|nr:DUF4827 domain-containing protein [Bacteroidaceae bacterium]
MNRKKIAGNVKINILKQTPLVLLVALFALLASCDDAVTYSEMKEKEREAVKNYLKSEGLRIISYDKFIANDSVTDVARNEYVEVDEVYMQIVRNPKDVPGAHRIAEDSNCDMLVRYFEYNIQDGDTISGNTFYPDPDEMRVTNKSGSYSATFTSGMMKEMYGAAVPAGWLVPLRFLSFTRSQSNLAKVNLIVPHTKGTSNATMYVYPCRYQITYQPSVAIMKQE